MGLLTKFKKPFEKLSKGKGEKSVKAQADKQDEKVLKKELKADKKKDKKGKDDKKAPEIKLKDTTGQAGSVIVRPLQTEKNTELMALNQYAFEVATRANKVEVKRAVENVYKVKPVSVNIVNMRGKMVRFGRTWAKRKNWKKAIVTLKAGDKIEVFEGI